MSLRAPRPPPGAARFLPRRPRPDRARAGGADGIRVTPPSSEAELLAGERRASSFRSRSRRPSAAQPRHGTPLGFTRETSRTVSPTCSSSSTPRSGLPVSTRRWPRYIRNHARWSWSTGSCSGKSAWSMTRAASSGPLAPAARAPRTRWCTARRGACRARRRDRSRPQIRERRSKIAAMRLTAPAPHQDERDIEDVAAAAA